MILIKQMILKILTCTVILLHISTVYSDSYCTTTSEYMKISPTNLPDDYKCNETTSFNTLSRGHNTDTIFGEYNYCEVFFIFDLSDKYMNLIQFNSLQFFLNLTVNSCMNNNIGRDFHFINLNETITDDGDPINECCDRKRCEDHIFSANETDITSTYYDDNNDDVIDDNSNFVYNYTGQIVLRLKRLSNTDVACKYNTVVLITNRLVDFNNYTAEFDKIFSKSCIYFSVIVVGRPDITYDEVLSAYSTTTKYLYLIHDYDCLINLSTCISPCNMKTSKNECKKEILDKCIHPTTHSTPTTTLPPSTTEKYPTSMHVLYTFALSDNCTDEKFQIILNSIKTPVQLFMNNFNLTFALVLTTENISPWFTNLNDYDEYIKTLTLNDTYIRDVDICDEYNPLTTKRLNATMQRKPLTGPPVPDITLITDFISVEFINTYESVDTSFPALLSHYSFHIVCTTEYVYNYYQNSTNLSKNVYYFNYTKPKMVPIDGTPRPPLPQSPKISEKAVLIIIFGAIGGALVLLCAGSFIYRQRMSWKTKLENIRVNHKKNNNQEQLTDITDIHLDYWELTWDRLLVKSDKLGSGAYGQVLRGKIIGQPPCVEHYYQNLQIRNFTHMENCDVAIKMLPKYADKAAKKEFTNEIELMKLLGYHDNIVNMLGCVTVGHPLCLVLEFCPFRDLNQYVKARKVEVNISNSIEEKINHTKDFLIFAWQIAHGMKYLSSKNIIHRDLAARNILIDADRNAKISDFGLCLQITENSSAFMKSGVNASGRLPIKWLAIESLKNHEFSYKSDVWSFGIVLFEMYSFGEIPFAKIEPKDLLNYVEAGNRPEKPELCSQEIYDIMQKCWHENPTNRPSFEELLTVFTVFLERTTEGYGYLPLLKSETTQNTNEISQKLAANMNNETNDKPKSKRKRQISTDSSKFLERLTRRWSTLSNAKSDQNDDDSEVYQSNDKWIKSYYNDDPDIEKGEKRNSTSTSTFSLDPGVEIFNGRPRLRCDISDDKRLSMGKSLSFNHADNLSIRKTSKRPSMLFTEKILKKFKKDTHPKM